MRAWTFHAELRGAARRGQDILAVRRDHKPRGGLTNMPGDIRTPKPTADFRADHQSLVPDMPLSRRGFVVTSLSAGFAAAAMPVSAPTRASPTTRSRR